MKVTMDEAARQLGVSRRSLARWKEQGAPGFEKPAHTVMVDVARVREWRTKHGPRKTLCPHCGK